jgi:DNA-binding GntR family transcriptional regulator
MLDQNNAVPLYKQLKEAVLGLILSGHLRAGDQLSTEQELSAQYSVSRITVRNAVTELVNEGYLQKRQGKGTFVCLPKIKRKAVHLLSFTATCEASGMSAHSVVSKKQVLDDYPAARRVLGLGPDDRVAKSNSSSVFIRGRCASLRRSSIERRSRSSTSA